MRKRLHTAIFVAALVAVPALAVVPGEMNYQGLLLDSGGSPVTGSVALDFDLFEVATGGTAVWSESHTGVAVTDGVYDVLLGSTTPITPALVAGGALWLELSVDSETLAPRQRLVAVPYALRADTAENASGVGGLSSLVVTEIFEHVDFDGGAPPNDDPSEGFADPDADGLANFIDPDNDNDAIPDVTEVAEGTDINVVTPKITSLTPDAASSAVVTHVTVTGSSFDPAMSVSFGSQSPTPLNVTATSFEVDVGPQVRGTVNVTVTLPNLETSFPVTFQFLGTVFVTSQEWNGNLGGIAGADAKCASAAAAASIPGTYLAWISDGTTDPASRFVQTHGWGLTDSTSVADSWADLSDGSIDNPIDRDENDTQLATAKFVWTNTETDGTAVGTEDCNGWTSASGLDDGISGQTNNTNDTWTNSLSLVCNSQHRLYCFEQ